MKYIERNLNKVDACQFILPDVNGKKEPGGYEACADFIKFCGRMLKCITGWEDDSPAQAEVWGTEFGSVLKLKPGDYLVLDPDNIRVMSEADFHKKYERHS